MEKVIQFINDQANHAQTQSISIWPDGQKSAGIKQFQLENLKDGLPGLDQLEDFRYSNAMTCEDIKVLLDNDSNLDKAQFLVQHGL